MLPLALLLALPLAAARTDLAGCTRTLLDSGSYLWLVPDTNEICAFPDCGGGRAPPKTTVPGCAAYAGTETYSPSFYTPATQTNADTEVQVTHTETGATATHTEAEATETITSITSSNTVIKMTGIPTATPDTKSSAIPSASESTSPEPTDPTTGNAGGRTSAGGGILAVAAVIMGVLLS